MYEIVSGNIVENIQYQVIGTGTGIIYNSVTYNLGDYFTGVSGIDTYSKIDGTEIVTEASSLLGLAIAKEDDFFLGKFTDKSSFEGLALAYENAYYPEEYTTEEIIQNDKNFIGSENLIRVPYLIDEITSVVGTELYHGVSFERLKELGALHPEITLTMETNDNIAAFEINGIKIIFKTS